MKVKVTIKGSFGVGYRVKLINMALEYGIDKFCVFNTEIEGKQAVICLIDASDEIVEIIKQEIEKEKPDKAFVESISFEDYKYEVPPIERCMQAFQISTGLSWEPAGTMSLFEDDMELPWVSWKDTETESGSGPSTTYSKYMLALPPLLLIVICLTYVVPLEMLAEKLSGLTVRFASCTVTFTLTEKWYTAAMAILENSRTRRRLNLFMS